MSDYSSLHADGAPRYFALMGRDGKSVFTSTRWESDGRLVVWMHGHGGGSGPREQMYRAACVVLLDRPSLKVHGHPFDVSAFYTWIDTTATAWPASSLLKRPVLFHRNLFQERRVSA